ncbi:MAG: ACT domain-containing protein [Armatimonadetes bacterium]|nr:MAG: ACT domain-containing protein [Armatimonadota bacterium]
MAHVTKGKEFIVEIRDEVGAGAAALETLSKQRINLACFVGYGVPGGKAYLHLVPEDPERAQAALASAGYAVQIHDAILYVAEDRPGLAADVLRTLADAGISVEHCYATSVGATNALLVIRTKDDDRATAALSDRA